MAGLAPAIHAFIVDTHKSECPDSAANDSLGLFHVKHFHATPAASFFRASRRR